MDRDVGSQINRMGIYWRREEAGGFWKSNRVVSSIKGPRRGAGCRIDQQRHILFEVPVVHAHREIQEAVHIRA